MFHGLPTYDFAYVKVKSKNFIPKILELVGVSASFLMVYKAEITQQLRLE